MAESIKTLKASGGDYTDPQTWWDTECATYDCVTNITSPILESYNDWPAGLNKSFIDLIGGAGFNRNDTYRPIWRAAPGHGHGMVSGTGFHVRSGTNYGYIIKPNSCDVEEIEFQNTATGAAANSVLLGASRCRFLIAKVNSSSVSYPFYNITDSSDLKFSLAVGGNAGYLTATWKTINLSCCGAVGSSIGFYSNSNSTLNLKNCWTKDCTTGFGGGGAWGSSSNNASDESSVTAKSVGTIAGLSDTDFVDAANDDYHLSTTSQLIGAGANLYTDGSDVDIDGEAWPDAAWDIGFDYYVAAGGGGATGAVTATLEGITATLTGTSTQPPITGLFSAQLNGVAGALSGSATIPQYGGDISATLGGITASLTGAFTRPTVTGLFSAQLAGVTSALSGGATVPQYAGQVGVTLDGISASLTGSFTPPAVTGLFSAQMDGVSSALSGSFSTAQHSGQVVVSLAGISASLAGSFTKPAVIGTFAAQLDGVSAMLSGGINQPLFVGSVNAVLDDITSAMNGGFISTDRIGTLGATLDGITAHLSGLVVNPTAAGGEHGGFMKLNELRQYLLAAPLGLNPDNLLTFIDKGKVISYPGGNNKHFKFAFPAQVIIIGYADEVDKLAFFIIQWLDQYQPDHGGQAFEFDVDIIDHRQADVSITLTLTETITVAESPQGITLNHCTEPNIQPITIPGDSLQVLLNDESLADWVNGGKYETYHL